MVQLVCHILHILATCISLGGLFYSRVVLLPNLKYLPVQERYPYLNKMIKRFSYIKWTGIIILTFTGFLQLQEMYPLVQEKASYLAALGLKMGGAIGLLTITSLLALPNEKLSWMQKNRRFWAGLNLFFGLIILIGAALMREIRNGNF